MFRSYLRKSFTVSFVISCIITPALVIAMLFYHIFNGTSKDILFDSIRIITQGSTGFSFIIKPQLFLVIIIIFIISFLISILSNILLTKSKMPKGEL